MAGTSARRCARSASTSPRRSTSSPRSSLRSSRDVVPKLADERADVVELLGDARARLRRLLVELGVDLLLERLQARLQRLPAVTGLLAREVDLNLELVAHALDLVPQRGLLVVTH